MQTYTKTEACILYSRVLWIFLPNVIKIQPYYFELYHLKVCTFFLRHSVVLWHRFGDVAGSTLLLTPPLFHYNFGAVPIGPDHPRWCCYSSNLYYKLCYKLPNSVTFAFIQSRDLKLFGLEIIFEVFQSMWSRYLNVTDGQMIYWWYHRALCSIAR